MESTVLHILSKETAYFFLFSMLNIWHVFQFHAEVEIPPQETENTGKGSDIICHMMCYFKIMS